MSPALARYIHSGWEFLRRHPLDSAPDPKVNEGSVSFLYIPASEDIEKIKKAVERRAREVSEEGKEFASSAPIKVRPIPHNGIIPNNEHGLLYLPHDYVVPGGRFNEMYGWDSYWIIKGLLDADQKDLALGMVRNFFYEIEHYGNILNANRTYYLSRSQPPFLGLMIDEVANLLTDDERLRFLKEAVPYLKKDCAFWEKNRLTSEMGLFHYGHPDMGKLGPCPEVAMGEIDPETGMNHYDKVIARLKALPEGHELRSRFYDPAKNTLTPEAIASDRGVRESGFDPSAYMGFFGLETLDYNPVCLNSLMVIQYKTLSAFLKELSDATESAAMAHKAETLAATIREKMWNEKKGLFFSYNRRTGKPSTFPFLTTMYPLFAKIATPEQAAKVRDKINETFVTNFGIMTTPEETGCQWDGPNMWPPLVDITVAGLHAYSSEKDKNFDNVALAIATKYLRTVQDVFNIVGANFEKYNARTGKNDTISTVGYKENVIGFGWTNAVVVRLNAFVMEQTKKHSLLKKRISRLLGPITRTIVNGAQSIGRRFFSSKA